MSSEEISVRFGVGQRSIATADLDTFVSTGEIPRSLQWYADRLTEEQKAELRIIMQKRFEIEPRTVSTFANSALGESLLRRLLVLFWGGPNDEALLRALRSSLVAAAFDDEGLTIMNAIRHYPLSTLRFDLGVGLKAADQFNNIISDSENIFAAIQQQGATGLTASSSDALPASFRAPSEPGSLPWEKERIEFTNPERGPGEAMVADLYLPQGLNGPAPLVVISHGLASNRSTFAYLAEHLASHGFAVATFNHPNTDAQRVQQWLNGFASQPDPRLFVNRPKDISALLDELERKATSDSNWEGRLRTDGVGVFGQSLGGYTVLAAGGSQLDFDHLSQSCLDDEERILPFNLSLILQCKLKDLSERDSDLYDDRVGAVLAVNPLGNKVFGPNGMRQLQVPVMVVAASRDFLTPAVPEQIEPFTWLENDERYLVLVEKGTHFSFLTQTEEDLSLLPPVLIGPDPELARPAMQWMATTFFETYINESIEHDSLLTELLLPSRSREFKYALTRSFTQEDLEAALEQN